MDFIPSSKISKFGLIHNEFLNLEHQARLELATSCLEDKNSTIELLMQIRNESPSISIIWARVLRWFVPHSLILCTVEQGLLHNNLGHYYSRFRLRPYESQVLFQWC